MNAATGHTALHFDRLTRAELRELAPGAVALVPLGSTEQHGPHLPSGTDTAIINAIATRAVAQLGADVPVVVLPTMPYGVAGHHLPFGATGSLSHARYLDLLTELGESLVESGFRRLVFLNGHGGNDPAIQTVGNTLVNERHLDVHVAATSYWAVGAAALADFEDRIGPIPGHAGSFESSCILAIAPDLVRLDAVPAAEAERQPLTRSGLPGAVVSRPGIWQASDGRSDDSHRADATLGDQALTAVATAVADFLRHFYDSTLPAPGGTSAHGVPVHNGLAVNDSAAGHGSAPAHDGPPIKSRVPVGDRPRTAARVGSSGPVGIPR